MEIIIMKTINVFMLLVASVVIGTTVPLSTYASAKQLSSTNQVQYVYKHNLKTIKIFNNNSFINFSDLFIPNKVTSTICTVIR